MHCRELGHSRKLHPVGTSSRPQSMSIDDLLMCSTCKVNENTACALVMVPNDALHSIFPNHSGPQSPAIAVLDSLQFYPSSPAHSNHCDTLTPCSLPKLVLSLSFSLGSSPHHYSLQSPYIQDVCAYCWLSNIPLTL